MSERVEVMTRAVNVEALKPCSAPTMKYASSARAVPASGRDTGELVEEALDQVERRIGLDRLLPARSRAKAASAEGENDGQGPCLLDGRWPRQVLRRAPRRDRGPQRVHRLGRRGQRAKDGAGPPVGMGPVGEAMRRVPVAGPQEVRDGRVGPVATRSPIR